MVNGGCTPKACVAALLYELFQVMTGHAHRNKLIPIHIYLEKMPHFTCFDYTFCNRSMHRADTFLNPKYLLCTVMNVSYIPNLIVFKCDKFNQSSRIALIRAFNISLACSLCCHYLHNVCCSLPILKLKD